MATRKRALLGVGLWKQEIALVAKSKMPGWPQRSIEYASNLKVFSIMYVTCVHTCTNYYEWYIKYSILILYIRTSGEVHTSFANLSASRSLDEGQGVGREEAVRGQRG